MAAGVRIMWPRLVSVRESEGETRAEAGCLAREKTKTVMRTAGAIGVTGAL